MRYEIIMFDADDTLFDFKKSEREALKNAMLEFAIEYDEDYHLKIYTDINTAIWKEFENGLITQKELRTERFRRFSDSLNYRLDEAKFADVYTRHLSNVSYLYAEGAPLIESLHRSCRLAVITNGLREVQNRRLEKSAIGKYFENVVISEEVGVSKPDPRIFEIALSNMKHSDKSRVLMVGDSLATDIQGGINFGIDTCWFNPGKIANESTVKPTYEIHNLLELKHVLEE